MLLKSLVTLSLLCALSPACRPKVVCPVCPAPLPAPPPKIVERSAKCLGPLPAISATPDDIPEPNEHGQVVLEPDAAVRIGDTLRVLANYLAIYYPLCRVDASGEEEAHE